MQKYIIVLFLTVLPFALHAQKEVRVVDNKGTIQHIDPSKWYNRGGNLFNKNLAGNVAIGLDTTSTVGARLVVNGDGTLPPFVLKNIFSGTTTNDLLTWNSSTGAVEKVVASNFAWLTTGNAGSNPSTNFLGTTDVQDFIMKTNATEAMRIDANQKVGIGTSTPTEKLDVNGTINANNYTTPIQATATGTAYTWDLSKGATTKWNLAAGANTLTVSNAKAGMYGTIILTNTGTSTLTFAGAASGANSKVINGGAGVVTLTPIAGATDILSFLYDGISFWWTIGNNYN